MEWKTRIFWLLAFHADSNGLGSTTKLPWFITITITFTVLMPLQGLVNRVGEICQTTHFKSRFTDCKLSWNSVIKTFSRPSRVSLFFIPSLRESNTLVTLDRRAWMALIAWEKASKFTPTFITSAITSSSENTGARVTSLLPKGMMGFVVSLIYRILISQSSWKKYIF